MMTGDSDYFYLKRREQTVQAMYDSIDRQLKDRFFGDDEVKQRIKELEKKVLSGKMSAYQAAGELLKDS